MRRAVFVLLLSAPLLPAGCSRGPTLVPVHGRVTLEGKPLEKFAVNFTPVGETQGNGGLAGTDGEGRFKLMDVRGEMGVRAGEYKVSFYPLGGAKVDDPAQDVVATPKRAGLPGVFIDPAQTPLRATIPTDGATVKLTLTRSGQGTAKVTPGAPPEP